MPLALKTQHRTEQLAGCRTPELTQWKPREPFQISSSGYVNDEGVHVGIMLAEMG